jgi:hypothetical protein
MPHVAVDEEGDSGGDKHEVRLADELRTQPVPKSAKVEFMSKEELWHRVPASDWDIMWLVTAGSRTGITTPRHPRRRAC